MSEPFVVKQIFPPSVIATLVERFGLRGRAPQALADALHRFFGEYVLLALSELPDNRDERNRVYTEAVFHLEKASKLLRGQAHPAGGMAMRLDKMSATLRRVQEGQADVRLERAERFVEKNLARNLHAVWRSATATPFYFGGDDSGRNPRDFLLFCFEHAARAYPEIEWFTQFDLATADHLIRAVRAE